MAGDESILTQMREAALEAGAAVMVARDEGVSSELKADRSPVTRADRLAEAIILRQLAAACPDVPVVAEEAFAAGRVPAVSGRPFFLVDPIDGTREFVAGRDEFTVNIALVEDGRPVAGIVFVPAMQQLYVGSRGGAFREDAAGRREPIAVRAPQGPLVALASRSHRTKETNDYLSRNGIETVVSVGSSLKFCRLAEGEADLYPCFGPTMEWDTAAGHAVLDAAGGQVVEPDGGPLTYGKRQRENAPDFGNPFFVALGGVSLPRS